MDRIRLLLVDDHILFREGLSRLLAAEPDLEIAGACGSEPEALECLAGSDVDMVLLDFDLGEDHGTELMTAARSRGYAGKVLMVTAGVNAAEAAGALQAGASGIFLKHDSPGMLAAAIRRVAAGEVWLDRRVVDTMAQQIEHGGDDAARPLLTEREQTVLSAIFEGLSNKEIAARIGVTEGAVKATLQQLFRKTRVRTRSQLVRIALEGSLGLRRD